MRALIQRVTSGSVTVEGVVRGKIGKGLVVLLGVTHTDDAKAAEYIASKCAELRIFEDDQGKLNLSVEDIKGEILLVSQFTLYGSTRKGRRPSFDAAAPGSMAEPLYEEVARLLRTRGIPVATGVFGALMQLEIHNDGPVTFMVESPTQIQ
jgi:D-tyrosyl-tRNA(Tyr) deacylase